jgi:hypothetical protein
VTKLNIKEDIVTTMCWHGIQSGHVFFHLLSRALLWWCDSGGSPGLLSGGTDSCVTFSFNALCDRNYTAMHTHVWRSVHLSALFITWFTWGDGLQRRYASDVAFCIVRFPLTVDNSDMN